MQQAAFPYILGLRVKRAVYVRFLSKLFLFHESRISHYAIAGCDEQQRLKISFGVLAIAAPLTPFPMYYMVL